MKKHSSVPRSVLVVASAAMVLNSPALFAASSTWLNTGNTDGNWATANNWNATNGVPGATVAITGLNANADVATFNTTLGTFGTVGSPIVVDANRNIRGISFGTAAGSYVIGSTGGNTLYLSSGGVIQNSGLTTANTTQTINAPIQIQGTNGTYTFQNNATNASGTLKFNGTIGGGAAGATVLTLAGSNTNANEVAGVIGNGAATSVSVVKNGDGNWTLSGANTYGGTTTVNSGALILGNASATAGASNNVTVNSGGSIGFGYALDQATLAARIASGSLGTVALGVSSANNLDLGAVGVSDLSLGAYGSAPVTYSGSLWTPVNNVYRLGGGGGTLVFNPVITGASNRLLVGGGNSGGAVTLVNVNTYGGSTTVTGARGGGGAIGTAAGAGLLQTNILAGTSTTPFGTQSAITLSNGALGVGTAGTLASGEAVNAAGYNITYSGQNALVLKAGAGSATIAANSLTRANNGVLLINPTSGATLGNTEKVTVATGAPTVTNGMVAGYYINGTTRNFLTYGANGFQDAVFTKTTLSTAGATDIVSLTDSAAASSMGGNRAIQALKLINTSGQYSSNAVGDANETLTILSGSMIIDMTAGGGFNFSADRTRANINFGNAEALVGVLGTGSAAQGGTWYGTGGFTLYGGGVFVANGMNFTGGINVAGGTYRAGNTGASGTGNVLSVAKGGTFQFGFNNAVITFAGLSGDGLVNSMIDYTGASFTGTLNIDGYLNTGTTTFTGSIQNNGGTAILTKYGANTQVLTGANTYTGLTRVSGGTLQLDFSGTNAPANNIINNTTNSSALNLSGGRLAIVGAAGATNSQRFNGTTIGAGNSSIGLTTGSGGGSPTVTLGSTFTRSAGGTLNIDDAVGGKVSTAAALTNTNGVLSTSASNPTAFATVNGNTWATSTSGVISGLSAYATGNANYTATQNVDVTNGDSVTAATVNTLRLNSGTKALTLSGINIVNTGGVLVTAGTTGSITGGTLKSAAGNELVFVNNGQLAVDSVLADGAAASALTLSGSGTTTLSAANTFTGGAYINSGNVVVGNANALGTAGTIQLNGGSLQTNASLSIGRSLSLNNNFTIGGSNNVTLSGVLTNTRSANTLTIANSANTTLSGNLALNNSLIIAGSGNVSATGLLVGTGTGITYSGTGTLSLTNAASTYTGSTRINSGVISVSTLANGGTNSSLGAATNVSTNLILDGGTLRYTGAGASTDRLFSVGATNGGGTIESSGTGALNFTSVGTVGLANIPGTRTITLGGTNTGDNTLNPIVTDHISLYATSVSKTGAGKWIVTGANTYSGGTSISGGLFATGATGTFGAGSVSLTGGGITLGNATSIADTAQVSFSSATLNPGSISLSFVGTETIGSLFDTSTGTFMSIGTYTTAQLNAFFGGSLFSGDGLFAITSAVPEPSTYAAIFGALTLAVVVTRRAQQKKRRNRETVIG